MLGKRRCVFPPAVCVFRVGPLRTGRRGVTDLRLTAQQRPRPGHARGQALSRRPFVILGGVPRGRADPPHTHTHSACACGLGLLVTLGTDVPSSLGAVAAPGRGACRVLGSRGLCCEGLSSLPMGPRHRGALPSAGGRDGPQDRQHRHWGRGLRQPRHTAQRCPRPAWRFSAWSWVGVRRVGLADGTQPARPSVCDVLSVSWVSPVLMDALSCGSARAAPFPHRPACAQVCPASACRARPLAGRAGTRQARPVASARRTLADSDAGTLSGGRKPRPLAGAFTAPAGAACTA